MKISVNFLMLIILVLPGCLSIQNDSSKSEAVNESSISSEPQSLNFNPNREVDISGIVEAYPNLQKLIVESEGITGVALSADEAKSMSSVTLGSPGLKGEYTYTVILSNGSIVQGRL